MTGAGRREWMGLAVIALPCLLYSMDLTVLELAVPKLSADLKPTSSQLLWIMDIFVQDGVAWLPVLSITAGLAAGVLFARRQRELEDPLIDLRLFREPAFGTSLAAFLFSIFVIAGTFFFVAQYLQLVLRLSPLQAGLWTLPSAGGLVAGSLLAPLVARRVRPDFVMAAGLTLSAAGFGMLTQVETGSGLAILVVGSAIFSLGAAPVGTLATDQIVGSVPPEKAGAASGISETSAEFGGALGIAVLGSIGTAVYRSRVGDALPAGVPPDAAEAARDTLGGAASAAEGLPDRLGAGLLDAAREAFTQGLHLTAVTSAALVLGMAVLVSVLLRDVRSDTGYEGHHDPSLDGAVPGSMTRE